MIVPVSTTDWQMLRYVLRAEAAGQPPLGRELRINMSRRTKDGTFLDNLVALGLLAVAAKPAAPADGKAEPSQFRARYRLTPRGRHAAEYGEYDRPFTPMPQDLFGLVAELRADTEAVEPAPRKKGKG